MTTVKINLVLTKETSTETKPAIKPITANPKTPFVSGNKICES
ncbi:MAG: hypothetical protein ACD_38C00041G0002 [uncultured bacterium]|nr:MAG: hypothetical protein ACD_38C00041G0002 [uncultured bacterium]